MEEKMKLKSSLASWFSVVAFGLALAFFAIPANAGSTVYVVTLNAVNFSTQFGVVDLASGSFHAIGGATPEQQESLVWGPNGLLYTLGSASGNLETINPATGVTTVVGPTGLPSLAPGVSSVFSLADLNGKLYLTDHGANFYSVNPITGAATLIGPTGMPPDPAVPGSLNPDGTLNFCDQIFNAVGGKLYGTFDSYTFNPVSGTVASVVTPPNLWRINPSTGLASLIGSTNLNLDGGVELNGKFYAFYEPNVTSQLVTLDLASGNTTFLENINPNAGLIFGAAPTPEPGTFLLLGSGLGGIAGLLRRRWR
jgi:hypothetical protein